MKNYRTMIPVVLLFAFFINVFPTLTVAQESPGNPEYSWLNGKWSGPAPAGGILQMDLKVINGNQIVGSGHVRTGGTKRGARPSITGTVNNNQVELELFYPRTNNTVRLRLSFVDGTLTGESKKTGFQATFKKDQ